MSMRHIPVVGFVAPSGTGKTTLLRGLIPLLRERGLTLGYLKHTHHAFELDTPGKDSWEIGHAGAAQVMLASSSGWALLDHRPAPEQDLADADLAPLAARFDADGIDLLLLEGFHRARCPKIEVHRSATGKAPMYPQDEHIIAVVTDAPLPGDDHPPVLPIDDPAAVADFILARLADGRLSGADARDQILEHHRRLRRGGHDEARLGTASVRVGGRFWITPAWHRGELGRDDLIACAVDGDELPERAAADTAVHRALYRARPEARAVLHAHGPYSVAVSFAGRDFQPVDQPGLRALGTVPVLTIDPDQPPEKPAEAIAEALADFPLCLAAAHGSYAWGTDLGQAARWTELVELSAKIYVIARQAAAL